jgi:cytochrome c-type biogenesis protein CcmH/NrfG
MREVAQKLMSLRFIPNDNSQLPSAIFGSTENLARFIELSRPRVRVGLWPFRSSTEPETALGLATVLGYLLERWADLSIYRLFVRIDQAYRPGYQWTVAQSQFDVDDWQMEGLDENIAIWGSLTQEAGTYTLSISVENDLVDEEEPRVYTKQSANLADLIQFLPEIADAVAQAAELGEPLPYTTAYSETQASDSALKVLLQDLFHWERKLLLSLWGETWEKATFIANLTRLLDAARTVGGTIGAWAAAQSAARALLPGFQPLGDNLLSSTPQIIETFEDSPIPAILIAPALYSLGYAQEGYDLLEDNQELHPDAVTGWLLLADLYARARRMGDALDTFQQALDEGIKNADLYTRYGELLVVLNYENWQVEEFSLIDPETIWEERLLNEAIAAYKAALELEPQNADALYQLLMQEIELDGTPPWEQFQRLIDIDADGDRVRRVSESLYNADDLSEPVHLLRRAIQRDPKRYDLRLSLAVVLTLDEQAEAALNELENIGELDDLPEIQADVELLTLYAEDAEFEQKFGEYTDIVSAGNELDVEDVEYLEEKAAQAPHVADLYVVLGKAYLAWDEPATALETLLDGQKHLPDHPDILELLARVLWQTEQQTLAFDYLRKGLAKHPDDVAMLALMGRFQFESDNEGEAKAYLIKAEAIAPRHPALLDAKKQIALQIQQDED